MKLSILLLLISTLTIHAATGYSQQTKLTVNLKNATVSDLVKSIEDQSEFIFVYHDNIIDMNQRVNVDVKKQNIDKVLEIAFENSNNSFQIFDRQIVIGKKENAKLAVNTVQVQTAAEQPGRTINGVVTDIKGEPIPGATIYLKGTNTGITTDIDGKFNLIAPANAEILVVSFVGMQTQEISIEGQSNFKISMKEESVGVDEVVVVGYGTQKKVNLTGAVSAVKIDEKITSRSLSNVSSGMSGLVPGLAVTQSSGMAGRNTSSLLIRGLGSTNNSNPLIVVDGMPDVDINRINMNDIESISVLKDAASSAIYGSRAANGVILITTKSGKGTGKTSINFTGSFGIEKPTNAYAFMPDYARALTLHQRASAVNTLKQNQNFKDGTIDQWMALGMLDPLRFPNTDWWDVIMRNGQVQNYALSASGSNEKSNFFISIGLMDEKGLQINNDYKRYNARFNYDYKVRDNMNVGARFDGSWSKFTYAMEDGFTDDNSTNTAGFDIQYAIAGITPYDPQTGYYGGTMAYNEDLQAFNPYTQFVNSLNYQDRQEANASAYWDWTPIKGLTARVDYALKYYNQFRYSAPLPNRSYNFQTGTFGTRWYVGENAGIGNYTNTGYKTLLNSRINYHTVINNNHDINALAVYSEEFWFDRYQMGSRLDRLHPSLHELDAALGGINQSAGGNSSTEGLRSYIGRLNYTAYNKYLFEFNFRCDGSSKFLYGSKYGFFPSAAIGWKFTEESFINPYTNKWLSSGKFRFSYGELGNNSGINRYEQQETLDASHYMIDNNIAKGFVYSKMVNTELSWESTRVANFGLDLAFFDSRLTTEFDYYDRLTSGMLRPSEMSIHLTGAYEAPRRNIGDLRNRGVEGNFTWKDKAGDFSYLVNLNASHNATTLEKWSEFLSRGWTFLNMPYHFLYTFEDTGIAQTWQDVYNATPQGAAPGDILRKDLNGDGRIDDNDKKAYPRVQRDRPTTNFALNSNIAWKGLDFSILLQGAAGRKDYWINNYNNTNIPSQRYASRLEHWNNPWSWENRDGEWPRLGGSGNNRSETTYWLDNLAYLRIKNIQLGYTLPKTWLMILGIDLVRIYASAENLATLTSFRGLDPEKAGHKSDMYPLNKSFSIGINVGF